jgi:spermidine/putrescine transport system permease protein
MIWIGIFIVLPMFVIAIYAFTTKGNSVLTFQFTIDNFARFFNDSIFPTVLWRSLLLAFKVTVICLLIGYPTAYFMSRLSLTQQSMAIIIITFPMWINMLVRTYAWRGILQPTGLDGGTKVLIGMVYNFIPFMVLQIYSTLIKIDKSLINASHDLGADRFRTFKDVVLPLSLPGVISGITLVFLPSVSSFMIPKLLGGGSFVLIGNLVETYFVSTGDWNFGSAISLILSFVILLSMYFTRKFDYSEKEVDS